MDCKHAPSRLHDRTFPRPRDALGAIACLLAAAMAAPVAAQAIDEPGVHLVEPGYARDRTALQASRETLEPTPEAQACEPLSAGRDASPEDCVAPTDAKARQRSIEAAKRSGVELGTHVRHRNPPRPAQRSY